MVYVQDTDDVVSVFLRNYCCLTLSIVFGTEQVYRCGLIWHIIDLPRSAVGW